MEMYIQCRVAGCTRPIKGSRSTKCEKHAKAERRHGDPQQIGIKKQTLQPFIKQVAAMIKKDKTGKIEAGLARLKNMMEDEATGYLNEQRAKYRYRRIAVQELLTIAKGVTAVDIGCTVGAMYLLQEHDPRAFKSDRAFWFQLARNVRRLSPMGVGSYYNHDTRRTTTVYRDIPPKVTEIMAEDIVRHYRPFIAQILIRAHREAARAQEAEDLIKEGFREVA